jgi:hypothetical protein
MSETLSHPFKFGRNATKHDQRNIMLRSLVRRIPKLPSEYDFDLKHPGAPMRMLGNDQYGDCVEAASAEYIMRAELLERGHVPRITDLEVIAQYFRETPGHQDEGLVILDHLNLWRQEGLQFGSHLYRILAYAQIQTLDHDLVKAVISTDKFAFIGLDLPDDALDKFVAGKQWTTATRKPNPMNGHCILVKGYNRIGPVGITWGRAQQMSWSFWNRYTVEAFSLVDARDSSRFLDHLKMNYALDSLRKPTTRLFNGT